MTAPAPLIMSHEGSDRFGGRSPNDDGRDGDERTAECALCGLDARHDEDGLELGEPRRMYALRVGRKPARDVEGCDPLSPACDDCLVEAVNRALDLGRETTSGFAAPARADVRIRRLEP